MSRYLTRAKRTESVPGVPRPPTECSCHGCDQPTAILVAVVRDDGGKVRSGGFYDFGHGCGDAASLQGGYSWIMWVARCQYHYLRELYAAGRGVWSSVNPTGVPTIDDYRRLHGARAGAGTDGDGRDQGTQGANLARDTGAQPGSRDADPLATEGGDRDRGGDLERDELSDWSAGEAADWPFGDDTGADRAMEGIL